MSNPSSPAQDETLALNPLPADDSPTLPYSISQADLDGRPAFEVITARMLHEKTFSLGDGYRQSVLYAYPVHYQSGESFLDIDQTFVLDKAKAGAFTTRSSDISATCEALPGSQGKADELRRIVSLQSKGYTISLWRAGMLACAPVAMKENGAADAITDTSLHAQREIACFVSGAALSMRR